MVNLDDNVPGGVALYPGESTTGQTISVNTPNDERVNFVASIAAGTGANSPPKFVSDPVLHAIVGQQYEYRAEATDPDRNSIIYLLVQAPFGMTVDKLTGLIQWTPTADSPVESQVLLRVYDSHRGWAQQEFVVVTEGGNHPPEFTSDATPIYRAELDSVVFQVSAIDQDEDALEFWATNLPGGAVFDPSTKGFYWGATAGQAGTYHVHFTVSDGHAESHITRTIEIRPIDLPPVLVPTGGRLLTEGDALQIQLHATDPEGDSVRYSASGLPEGATLHPITGKFEWTPGYSQAGEYLVTFAATANNQTTYQDSVFIVLNGNGGPVFDPLESWRVFEGQEIVFRAFASDPDNLGYRAPTRTDDGELVYPGTTPTVALIAAGLPDGASFDVDTGIFRWTPDYFQAGHYQVTFTAIDDGDGTSERLSTEVTVPIHVRNLNRRPEIAEIENVFVNRGDQMEIVIPVTDPDGNPLVLTAESGLPGRPLPSFVTFMQRTNGEAVFLVTPGPGDRGNHPISLRAIDNGGSEGRWAALDDEFDFIISVHSENDPPIIEPIPTRVALAGSPFVLPVRVSDLDQETLFYSVIGLPNATIEEGIRYGTADILWNPTISDIGSYTVTVEVEDDGANGLTDPEKTVETFTLVVRSTNTPPSLTLPENVQIMEGSSIVLPLHATDADGDSLWFTAKESLPSGMTLNRESGEIHWTPSLIQAGLYSIDIQVDDGVDSETSTLSIEVLDFNQSPVIVPIAPYYVREGSILTFAVAAGDPEGDPVTVVASNLPVGARFDAVTSTFRWSPTNEQAGDYSITFVARDDHGNSDTYIVPIRVDDVNRSPLLNVSNRSGAVGYPMDFVLNAEDLDQESSLTYSALRLPYGASLDQATGRFTWTPGPSQSGDYVVTFQVSDGQAVNRQNVLLRITSEPSVPTVQIDLTPSFPVLPGSSIVVRVVAGALSEIAELRLTANGQPIALDGFGRATLNPSNPGKIQLVAEAVSVEGTTGRTTSQIRVRDTSDLAPPEVLINSPSTSAIISESVPVRISASDATLDYWRVEIARLGSSDFKTIAEGESELQNDSIYVLDPALLANGFYKLRLVAADIDERVSTTEIQLEIASTTKDTYRTSQVDFQLSYGTGTFDLTRTYDSQLAETRGSFGNGWRLAVGDFLLQTSIRPDGRESLGVHEPMRDGTRVYLIAPDGRQIGFTFSPRLTVSGAIEAYKPRWVADFDHSYTLESTSAILMKAGTKYYEFSTGLPYNASSQFFDGPAFTLTTPDGLMFELDGHGQTSSIRFPDGSRVRIHETGIVDSSGNILAGFVRDKSHRITSISTADQTLNYRYSDTGLLSMVESTNGASEAVYSYDQDRRISIITTAEDGMAVQYAPIQETPLAADLGTITSFSEKDIAGTAELDDQVYVIHISDSDLLAATGGRLVLRTYLSTGDGRLAPIATIDGTIRLGQKVRPGESAAFFEINSAGLYLLTVPMGTGDFTLQVGLAGDITRDGIVDANDGQALSGSFDALFGDETFNSHADIDLDGVVNESDQLLLLANYGFVTVPLGLSVAAVSIELEPESDTGEIGDGITSKNAVTLYGTGEPGATITLSPGGGQTQVQANGLYAFFDVPLLIGRNEFSAQVQQLFGSSVLTDLTIIRQGQESDAPVVTVQLSNDTGISPRDRLTFDPSIMITAIDESGIGHLELSMDGGHWIDITDRLEASSVSLRQSEIEELLAITIPDGNHRFEVRATDRLGNPSTTAVLTFVLDTAAPLAPEDATLVPATDLGISNQDGLTSTANIVLQTAGLVGLQVVVMSDDHELTRLPINSVLSGVVPISIPVLLTNEGTYQLRIATEDGAGNRTFALLPVEVTLDQQGPVAISAAAQVGTDQQLVVINGSTDANTNVALYRGLSGDAPIFVGKSNADGNFQFQNIAVAVPQATFRVVAFDDAGNSIQQSIIVESTVADTRGPRLALQLHRDTGSSSNDAITRDPTLVGIVDDASEIASLSMKVDDSPEIDIRSILNGSGFVLTKTQLESRLGFLLADGSHTVVLAATDSEGNAATPVEFTFTLDTVRPIVPSEITLPIDKVVPVAPATYVTRFSDVAISTSTDEGVFVQWFVNGEAFGIQTGGTATSLSLGEAKDGAYRITAQALDAAGNYSPFVSSIDLIFDTVPPLTPSFQLASEDVTLDGTIPETSSDVVDLVGTTEPGAEVQLVGTGFFEIADDSGEFRFTDIAMQPGDNTLTVKSIDDAGNESTYTRAIVMADRRGPTIEIRLASDTGISESDGITSDPTLTGFVRDASGVVSFEMRVDDGAWVDALPFVSNGFVEIQRAALESAYGSSLPDGWHRIQFNSIDGQSNETHIEHFTLTLDTVNPQVATPRLSGQSDSGYDNADRLTNDYDPILLLPTFNDEAVVWYVDDVRVDEHPASDSWEYQLPSLRDGAHEITAEIVDAAGNTSNRSLPLFVTIDTSVPSFVYGLPSRDDTGELGDRSTTKHVVSVVGTTEPFAIVALLDLGIETQANDSGSFELRNVPLAFGENVIPYVVTDQAGNELSSLARITREAHPVVNLAFGVDSWVEGVIESERPVVLLQAAIDDSMLSAPVDLRAHLSNDIISIDETLLEYVNGAPLSLARHTLYIRAVDDLGNSSPIVEFDLNASPQVLPKVEATIENSGSAATFSYVVTNRASVSVASAAGVAEIASLTAAVPTADENEWALTTFSLPVNPAITIAEIASPQGWSSNYSPGDASIEWVASSIDYAARFGTPLEFRFSANSSVGVTTYSFATVNATTGETRSRVEDVIGPAKQNGFAVYDRFDVTAGDSLVISAPGILQNDAAQPHSGSLHVSLFDETTSWGVQPSITPEGALTYDASGTVFQSLGDGEIVIDRVRYEVSDDSTTFGTVADVAIAGVNDPPTAVQDEAITDDGRVAELNFRSSQLALIPVSLLLGNDFDVDTNDVLSIVGVAATSARGATVRLLGDMIEFDPTNVAEFQVIAAEASIPDSFTYTLSDRFGASDTGRVVVNVHSGTNVPTIAQDDRFSVNDGATLAVPGLPLSGVLKNDFDPDAVVSDGPLTVAGHSDSLIGAAVHLFPNGGFTYDASEIDAIKALAEGETLEDSIVYTTADGAQATLTVVNVGRNDDPTVTGTPSYVTDDQGTFTVFADEGLLLFAEDPDESNLLRIDESLSTSAERVSIKSDGSFEYQAGAAFSHLADGQSATDRFTFVVSDAYGGRATGEALITIRGKNDLPLPADDGLRIGYSTRFDLPIDVNEAKSLLKNDRDPDDGDQVNAVAETIMSERGATVTIREDGTFIYDPRNSQEIRDAAEAGKDLIDTFTYQVTDGSAEASSADELPSATASVLVRVNEQEYVTDVVADTGLSFSFAALGQGPSINNLGDVGFQASAYHTANGETKVIDNLFLWEPGAFDLLQAIQPGSLNSTPASGRVEGGSATDVPLHRFHWNVQLNDSDMILAHRQMNVEAFLGTLLVPVPVANADFVLTYAERWNLRETDDPDNVGKTRLPVQSAMGDSGWLGAGGRWGDPFFRDLFGAAVGLLTSPLFGGFGLNLAFTGALGGGDAAGGLRPTAWVINPIWATKFFSELDRKNGDFSIIYSGGSLNNANQTAFPATLSSLHNKANQLVTAVHTNLGSIQQLGIGTPGFVAQPKLSDPEPNSGQSWIVVRNETSAGNQIFTLPYQLGSAPNNFIAGPSNGFVEIGPYPSITDDGSMVVFAAVHRDHGRGIYVADTVKGHFTKVVGVAEDGHLDPGESLINDGSIEGTDAGVFTHIPVDDDALDMHLGISRPEPGSARYLISFMATRVGLFDPVDTLQVAEFTLRSSPEGEGYLPIDPEMPIEFTTVAALGQAIDGVGIVNDIRMFDPLNTSGQVAFWAKTIGGNEAIVRARPKYISDLKYDTDLDGSIDRDPSNNNADENL
ncbi:MAG: putative Ig domain-containing protein, partial [Planctomycetales bacterium]|nr:putative Ig domain-containing protein [Planctomycetales bacterium]